MKMLSPVVWTEGMHLGPHHFQLQNRYFEDVAHFLVSSLQPFSYGWAKVVLSPEALANGAVSLVEARGVFSDGLSFSIPDCDSLPEPRAVADLFPPLQDRLMVYLAVPAMQWGSGNCQLPDDRSSPDRRYRAEALRFPDETTGGDEKPVNVGRKSLRILLETEPNSGLTVMPMARLARSGSGGFAFDRNFIPPCLTAAASPRLMEILAGLAEILEDKARTLLTSGGKPRPRTFTGKDVAAYWFLHSIHRSLPALRHLAAEKAHPEQIHLELSRLAGALCTFSLDSSSTALPVYDHDAPAEGFAVLYRHIRTHLELVLPDTTLAIALQPAGELLYHADVTDGRAFGRTQWILGVRSRAGQADIILRFPQLSKVCSEQFVPELVKRALPGLAIAHLPSPPAAISPQPDMTYFALSQVGPCWDHISQTRKIGVYVPADFPQAELELSVILGAEGTR